MKRVYFAALAISGFLTLIFSVGIFRFIVIMLTAFLGFPLIYAVNVFVGLLAFLPFVLLHNGWWPVANRRRSEVIALIGAAAGLAALLVVPAIHSKTQVAETLNELSTNNLDSLKPLDIKTIEIVNVNWATDTSSGFLKQTECGDICRSLLLSGNLEWVRMAHVNSRDNPALFIKKLRTADEAQGLTYVAGNGSPCRLRSDIASEPNCILLIQNVPAAAEARLVQANTGYGPKLPTEVSSAPFELRGWSQVQLFERADKNWKLLLNQRQQRYRHHTFPTFIVPNDRSNGYGFRFGEWLVDNEVDVDSVLLKMGYKIAEYDTPKIEKNRGGFRYPDEELTQKTVHLLNRNGQTPFGDSENAVLREWINRARAYRQWTPERVNILKKIIADGRISSAFDLDDIFWRDELTDKLIPTFLSNFDHDLSFKTDNGPMERLIESLRWVKQDKLIPHRTRLLKLAKESVGQKSSRILLPMARKLGVNPLSLLPASVKRQSSNVIDATQP